MPRSIKPRLILYPYKLGSESARKLAEAIEGTRRVRPDGNYHFRRNHRVINWGNPKLPNWLTQEAISCMLNKPQYIENASDKIKTLKLLREANVPCPDFTQSIDEARNFLGNRKYRGTPDRVVCRTLTRANSGRGIVVADNRDAVVAAPLFTRYIPKRNEYRIHVWRGNVIDQQEKKRQNGYEEREGFNKLIRNHENGWVFCRDGVAAPDAVKQAAIDAVIALKLDFGAVDVGYHPEFGVAVYEINTAPGLEGTTLEKYVEQARTYLG